MATLEEKKILGEQPDQQPMGGSSVGSTPGAGGGYSRPTNTAQQTGTGFTNLATYQQRNQQGGQQMVGALQADQDKYNSNFNQAFSQEKARNVDQGDIYSKDVTNMYNLLQAGNTGNGQNAPQLSDADINRMKTAFGSGGSAYNKNQIGNSNAQLEANMANRSKMYGGADIRNQAINNLYQGRSSGTAGQKKLDYLTSFQKPVDEKIGQLKQQNEAQQKQYADMQAERSGINAKNAEFANRNERAYKYIGDDLQRQLKSGQRNAYNEALAKIYGINLPSNQEGVAGPAPESSSSGSNDSGLVSPSSIFRQVRANLGNRIRNRD